MKKMMIIMRGLPGSGKSYEVSKLVDDALLNTKQSVIVCSADNFFMDHKEGYKFDPTKIGQAHAKSQITALRALRAGVELVIVDNTNTQKWEFSLYEEMAEAYNYEIEIKTVGSLDEDSIKLYAQRNSHGVPIVAIRRMAERFEK